MEIIKNEFLLKTPVPLLVTRHETKNGNGFSTIPILMSPPGFEPGTPRLKVLFSTNRALSPQSKQKIETTKEHIIIYRKIPIDYSDFAIKNYSNTFQLFYNLNQGITFWR